MTISTSDLVGGGAGLTLAPDLTFPSNLATQQPYSETTGIDASSGLTEVLGLSGKFAISLLRFSLMTSESITVKLTVDGEVIWNDTYVLSGSILVLYGQGGTLNGSDTPFICKSSLSLEVQTTADTSINFQHISRAIA